VILSTQNKEIYLYKQEIKDTLKRLDEHTPKQSIILTFSLKYDKMKLSYNLAVEVRI
jgi:hypothetical protein